MFQIKTQISQTVVMVAGVRTNLQGQTEFFINEPTGFWHWIKAQECFLVSGDLGQVVHSGGEIISIFGCQTRTDGVEEFLFYADHNNWFWHAAKHFQPFHT